MAYSDFTIQELEQRFGVTITEVDTLFPSVPTVPVPDRLIETIRENVPLAHNLTTEKARSELLVAPTLIALTHLHRGRMSFFSGIDFTVDPAAGLSGRADYILSRSPQQFALRAPACVLVEAKYENIPAGVPQCVAEMVAAQRFNQAAGVTISPVYGAVTTGLLWRFLSLDGTRALLDAVAYSADEPQRLFAVLSFVALGT